MTIANGCRLFCGRGTVTAMVWPAFTVTTRGPPPGGPPEPAAPMTETLALAAPAGAVSTRPTVSPRVAGLPATTPCSVMGGTAVVNEPMPCPGTRTAATIGTFEVSSRPAADAPRELSANDEVALEGASTGVEPNWVNFPWAVKDTTLSRASLAPGTVTKSRAELLATVNPGITRLVAGAPACGS